MSSKTSKVYFFTTFSITSLVLLSFLEGYFRKHDSSNPARPSIFLHDIYLFLDGWAVYFGAKLAFVTDIFSWIKDFAEDLVTVLGSLLEVIVGPNFSFLKGYVEYFKSNYGEPAVLTGLIISLMVICIVVAVVWTLVEERNKKILQRKLE